MRIPLGQLFRKEPFNRVKYQVPDLDLNILRGSTLKLKHLNLGRELISIFILILFRKYS
jgi:hypothetical protein